MENNSDKVKKAEKELIKFPSIINERSGTTDAKKSKEVASQERIKEYHNLIKNQMNSLNTDIDHVLQRHEQDFLNAFKYQMFNLYTQIKELKRSANSSGINVKHNEELHQLQNSLDWFKKEAVKLGETVEEYKKEVQLWKDKTNELETDCKFYKSRLKNAKRKIKQYKVDKSNTPNLQQTLITTVETTSPKPSLKFTPSSPSGEIISQLLKKFKLLDADLLKEIELVMEKQSKHFTESTKHYQKIITNERKKMQNLSVIQSSVFLEKSELENLFLDCVEEVKKEIGHRRAKSLHLQKFPLKSKNTPKEKNETFSPGDKRKIMELLISNEQVLIMLYEKLFPFRASQFGNSQKLEQSTVFEQTIPNIDELMKSIPNKIYQESP